MSIFILDVHERNTALLYRVGERAGWTVEVTFPPEQPGVVELRSTETLPLEVGMVVEMNTGEGDHRFMRVEEADRPLSTPMSGGDDFRTPGYVLLTGTPR